MSTFYPIPGGRIQFPFQLPNLISSNANLLTTSAPLIDAADEGVAIICRAPKTGNISKIGFMTGSTVGTGSNLDVRLESVNTGTTPATPGGLLATNTNASVTVATNATNTWHEGTLTAVGAVTKGDLIAIHIKQPSSSAGSCRLGMFGDDCVTNFPYTIHNTSSWAAVAGNIIAALGYDDGTYAVPTGIWAISAISSVNFNSGSSPNVRGARFTLSHGIRATGIWAWCNNNTASGGFNARLVQEDYHKANATGIIAEVSFPQSVSGASFGHPSFGEFSSSIELAAGTYRILVEPTSANNVQMYGFGVYNEGIFDAYNGDNFHYTQANNPTQDSDFLNYNTSGNGFFFPFCGLLVDAIEIPDPVQVSSLTTAALDQIANAVLTAPIDTSESDATSKCLLWMIAMALNQSALSGGTITVKKTDNSTNLFTQGVTQTSVDPITSKNEAS